MGSPAWPGQTWERRSPVWALFSNSAMRTCAEGGQGEAPQLGGGLRTERQHLAVPAVGWRQGCTRSPPQREPHKDAVWAPSVGLWAGPAALTLPEGAALLTAPWGAGGLAPLWYPGSGYRTPSRCASPSIVTGCTCRQRSPGVRFWGLWGSRGAHLASCPQLQIRSCRMQVGFPDSCDVSSGHGDLCSCGALSSRCPEQGTR